MEKSIRAFLSHSSSDKHTVDRVAEALGRAAVIYDAYEFRTGEEFKKEIIKGLARSDIFVLFASRESLKKEWVKLEINEAEKALTAQALSKILTYIIDDSVDLDSLPEWMKATRVERQQIVGLISLDIQRVLTERLQQRSKSYFVGRHAEMETALEIIASNIQAAVYRPLIIYGLDGIGRRSLLGAVARDHLSFDKLFTVELVEGDFLPELYFKILQRLSPGSISDPSAFVALQEARPTDELISSIIKVLLNICESQALPVILDRNAISNYGGNLHRQFDAFYDAVTSNRVDLAFITNRRMYTIEGVQIRAIRVAELSTPQTQNLLRLIARDKKLVIEPTQLSSLATYTRGYPPAARFAIDEAETYGVAHVTTNQGTLVNFSADIFLRQLKSDKRLSDLSQRILQILSVYSPLPPETILKYCDCTSQELSAAIAHLVDFAFILPVGANFRISEPLRDAAYRAFSGLYVRHERIAALLEMYLASTLDEDIRFSLAQTLFRATLLSQSASASKFAVGFASDLIQVATKSYHDQDYDLAIKYGREALSLRPDNADLLRYVAQALIRKEQFNEAAVHIAHLQEIGEIGTAEFVQGFQAKRQGRYDKAVEFYSKSIAYGRRGVAVYRDIASCYYELGDIEKANANIAEAESRSPHNRYVIDLRCTIALRNGDMDTAARTLTILERVDPTGFADHRRSTFEQANGDPASALSHAQISRTKFTHPPFEVLANLANCYIEMNNGSDALAAIRDLQQRFRGLRHDAQVGLQCKYEIKFGSIENASGLWTQLLAKDSPQHVGLRLGILNKKAAAGSLSVEEQKEYSDLSLAQSNNVVQRALRMLGSVVSRTE